MSAFTAMELIPVLLQSALLIPVIMISGKWMKDEKNGLLPVFFTFAMEAFLLCNVYYLVHGVLFPGVRLPFAADEIAECAMVFMLAAGLETIRKEKKFNSKVLLFSASLMALNYALWIIWNGEWMQDILFGLQYIYILYLMICGMIEIGCLTRREMTITAIVLYAAELSWFQTTWLTGILYMAATGLAYALMYLVEGWLLYKCVSKGSGVKEEKIYLSLAFFIWAILISFSSDGIFYTISQFVITLALPLMLLALKKELYTNDLC